MAKAIAAKTMKVMDYIRSHPDMPAQKVADKWNMHKTYIYKLKHRIKDEELTVKTNKALNGLTWTVSSSGVEDDIVAEQKEVTKVDAILDARAENYGKFIDGAEIMQMLKRMVHGYIEKRGTQLAFDQRESIDMMVHKLGRIINGNPDHVDSWRDIAGYATLVADRLEGNAR